jgi:hypothetical protein
MLSGAVSRIKHSVFNKLESNVIVFLFIFLYMVSALFGWALINVFSISLVSTLSVICITKRISGIEALVKLVLGFVALAIFGNIIADISKINFVSREVVVVCCAVSLIKYSPREKLKHQSILKATIGALGFSYLFTILYRTSTEWKVNFLGYGYDNVSHFAQADEIFSQNHSTMVSGSESIPTFLSNAAQGSASVLATLYKVFGSASKSIDFRLTIFIIVTSAIPLVIIYVVFLTLKTKHASYLTTSLYLTATAGIVYLSNASHIWYSGFYGSNLATALLVLQTGFNSTSKDSKFLINIIFITVIAHIYVLFALIAVAIYVLTCSISKSDIQNRLHNLKNSIFGAKMRNVVVAICIGSLLVPYFALKKLYGGEQFLADGGIEPLPVNHGVITCMMLLIASLLVAGRHGYKRISDYLPILFLAVIPLIAWYSIAETGRLQYYPIKLMITLVLIIFVQLVANDSQREKLCFRNIGARTLVLFSIFPVIFYGGPTVFTGPFMGSTPKVLVSAFKSEIAVVNGSVVPTFSDIGKKFQAPVLFYSSTNEPELNTRWVNTLSNIWTDASWSEWIRVKKVIDKHASDDLFNDIGVSSLVLIIETKLLNDWPKLNKGRCIIIESPITGYSTCDLRQKL